MQRFGAGRDETRGPNDRPTSFSSAEFAAAVTNHIRSERIGWPGDQPMQETWDDIPYPGGPEGPRIGSG